MGAKYLRAGCLRAADEAGEGDAPRLNERAAAEPRCPRATGLPPRNLGSRRRGDSGHHSGARLSGSWLSRAEAVRRYASLGPCVDDRKRQENGY